MLTTIFLKFEITRQTIIHLVLGKIILILSLTKLQKIIKFKYLQLNTRGNSSTKEKI